MADVPYVGKHRTVDRPTSVTHGAPGRHRARIESGGAGEARHAAAEPEPSPQSQSVSEGGDHDAPAWLTDGNAVKGEFLLGLVLFLLAPIGNSEIHVGKNYARRLVAYVLVFMLLFPMSSSSNPDVQRLASVAGGVFLLTLAVVAPTKGFTLNVTKLLSTVVAKLQPDSTPPSARPSAPGMRSVSESPGPTAIHPIPNSPVVSNPPTDTLTLT